MQPLQSSAFYDLHEIITNMFRRLWSGLPADVSFPDSLKGLGYVNIARAQDTSGRLLIGWVGRYFVNAEDEIRSIENADNYFKFFINRNPRINDRQRFHFDQAVEGIVHRRLEKEGLCRTLLPLGTPESEPHVLIFVSDDIQTKSRVVLIFGEPTNELGVIARRVAGGPGGLDKGSLVSVVRALKEQRSSTHDEACPGILLANTGETYWWPEGKRAITITGSSGVPLPSLAHRGVKYVPTLNSVPGNETAKDHVAYIFKETLSAILAKDATIDILAIGTSCELVERFLDQDANWSTWGPRLRAIALMGPVYTVEHLANEGFKDFLEKRTCAYLVSDAPLGTPIAPPGGNPNESIAPLGCPCFSSSEPWYTEVTLIKALVPVLGYLQRVALDPDFENEPIIVTEHPRASSPAAEDPWEKLGEHEKPLVTVTDPEWMDKERQSARGQGNGDDVERAPGLDSDDDSGDEYRPPA
ncbi:hypothetical protein S40293_01775 [Stachybotrys chartarum IBT 40293]|nr:hypothetical protein S40293_01775 [Stachybotrys chartarum IBT 40293]